MDLLSISSDHLQACVKAHGAELCLLRTGSGLDLLWSGDPAFWGRQAPVLFPVVGALAGNRLRHGGRDYPLSKHGFARDLEFRLVRLTAHSCCLRLTEDAGTLARYPFRFQLDVSFRIDGASLAVQYDLHNPADTELPASFGAHPAFRWPLLPGVPKPSHWLEFEKPEGRMLPLLDSAGLLSGTARPCPVEGRHLFLRDSLFADDALMFIPVQSRALRYSAPGAPVLELAWDGFHQLGLWSKPGAGFLCIEPWRGFASPAGFDGEFEAKPGVFKVGPGATVSARYVVRVLALDRNP